MRCKSCRGHPVLIVSMKQGLYFCRDLSCFNYFRHGQTLHKPLVQHQILLDSAGVQGHLQELDQGKI